MQTIPITEDDLRKMMREMADGSKRRTLVRLLEYCKATAENANDVVLFAKMVEQVETISGLGQHGKGMPTQFTLLDSDKLSEEGHRRLEEMLSPVVAGMPEPAEWIEGLTLADFGIKITDDPTQ